MSTCLPSVTTRQIAVALSEVLPRTDYIVEPAPSLGLGGVLISWVQHDVEVTALFDTSYGGDDEFTGSLHAYLTVYADSSQYAGSSQPQLFDILDGEAAPSYDACIAEPVLAAQWIAQFLNTLHTIADRILAGG